MSSTLRRHLTYANVVASLALFVALGGGAYAVSVPKKSVGSSQLRTNAVTSKKIKRNAVTNSKIKNDAVTGSKVKADSLTGSDILESGLGKVPSATSADNATTLNGKAAGAYPSNIVIRRKDLPALQDGGNVGASGDGGPDDGTVYCAAGERVISGGVRIAASGVDQAVSSSRPVKDSTSTSSVPEDGSSGANGWRGVASDSQSVAGNNPTAVQVFAICAS